MAFKVTILLLMALLVQAISGQCVPSPPKCDSNPCSSGSSGSGSVRAISIGSFTGCNTSTKNSVTNSLSSNVVVPSFANSGSSFLITSLGPVTPSGISIINNNDLYGELAVSGQLPFLSAVGFEGTFPTNGQASVNYGCGDDNLAIQEVIGGNAGCIGASKDEIDIGIPYGSCSFVGYY